MDAGIWRGLFTVFMFAAFVLIFFWAWSSRRKSEFEEMAGLPLENDEFVSVEGKTAGKLPQGEDES